MSTEKVDIHFITGFSRGGTTWLCKSLNSHSGIYSFGESCFWGRNYLDKEQYNQEDVSRLIKKLALSDLENGSVNKGKSVFKNVRAILNGLGSDLPMSPKEIFQELCDGLANRSGKKMVVEKTPHHINHIDRIRHAYPESKVIVMNRDGFGFYKSYKNIYLIKKGESRKAFKRSFHPLGAIMVYGKYKRSINYARSLRNTLIIEFEEVVRNSSKVLEEVQEFLSLPIEEIDIGRTNSSFTKVKSEGSISTEDRAWLALWGIEQPAPLSAREYVYAPFIFLYSICKLPLWGLNVIQQVGKMSATNPLQYLIKLLR